MARWMILALAALLPLAACAHPERIKTVSKEQEALLASFRAALEDVRSRVRTAFDESIEDYKEARLRKWVLTETGSFSTQIARCARAPATCEGKSTKVLLDEAGEYLARGQATLFGGFCGPGGGWEAAKRAWMTRQNAQCPDKPREVVGQLERLRNTLDASLLQLADDALSLQQAHAIIDKFLQIRIEIRPEDVDAAQKTITKATTAVQEVKASLAALGREAPR
jgi:hypothetical protein